MYTEQLIKAFKAATSERRLSVRKAAKEMGVNYQTLYWAINPDKRPPKQREKVKRTFNYEIGKTIEQWIK